MTIERVLAIWTAITGTWICILGSRVMDTLLEKAGLVLLAIVFYILAWNIW